MVSAIHNVNGLLPHAPAATYLAHDDVLASQSIVRVGVEVVDPWNGDVGMLPNVVDRRDLNRDVSIAGRRSSATKKETYL